MKKSQLVDYLQTTILYVDNIEIVIKNNSSTDKVYIAQLKNGFNVRIKKSKKKKQSKTLDVKVMEW